MLRRLALASLLAFATLAAPVRAAGLEVVSDTRVSDRIRDVVMRSDKLPAGANQTGVRLLLPTNYDRDTSKRYPVLWLLHGALSNYKEWVTLGDAETITRGLEAIVVMPDTGSGGGYANWFKPGGPQWEDYHLGQLLPWTDTNLRTIADRGHRAIAGLSMGGFGAMSYAARHPDLFGSATSFSGALDTGSPGNYLLTEFNMGDVGAVHGPRATEEVRWRGANPTDLASNLRHTEVTIRTGNGRPGGPGGDTGDPVEAGARESSLGLHRALDGLGIAHVWDDYGPGGHDWYYWKRGLRRLVPVLRERFAAPPAPPAAFDFKTIEPVYGVYGWTVAIDRPALEWSSLDVSSPSSFSLAGSGSAVLTTPPSFRPGTEARVRVASAQRTLTVGRDCRLRIAVDLGPGNPGQQYRVGTATRVITAPVSVSAAAGCFRTVVVSLRRLRRIRRVEVWVDGTRVRTLPGPRRTVRVRVSGSSRILVVIHTRDGRTHRIRRTAGL